MAELTVNVTEFLKKFSTDNAIKELDEVIDANNEKIDRIDIREKIDCTVNDCKKFATYKKKGQTYCWIHVRIAN